MDVTDRVDRIRELVAQSRQAGNRIGLVPTMGALHVGHISLIEAAREACGYVVVSIFVNPTQFCPGEDYEKYPRPIEADLEICREHGVDAVFAPTAEQIYGQGSVTWVTVEKLTEPLCGRFRPGHFRGVTTVCAKLFNIVLADAAFFGQKDGQQSVVIQRMVADLNMALEVVVCPTVRDSDGLAVSSRNQYLSNRQRSDATCLYRSLQKCREMIEAGQRDVKTLLGRMREVLDQVPGAQIEYVSIVDSETLQELEQIKGKVLVALAVRIGPARLIDNIVVDVAR